MTVAPVFSWGTTRRYNAWTDYCRLRYGGRIQKVVVNAGFSCPNRDGTVGVGGCSFCNNEGFSPSYCHQGDSIIGQIENGLTFLDQRYKKPEHYVAYFQSYSNTHAPLEVLEQRYRQALEHPRIEGLVVGTRPDCVNEQKLDYLARLAHHHMISVEYGLESCYNDTLKRINRGHTFEQSVKAIEMSAARGLHTGIHIIFGLPGESRLQMLQQANILSELPISSIKFHQLQIVKGTAIESEYASNPDRFNLFGMEEYIQFIVSFVEQLRPDITIERFSGEVPPRLNAGPSWGKVRSDQVMVRIERELARQDTWQGRCWQKKCS
ncbi:MAG: TIGR01212 family radical SAM protein [Bacteroidales bacterium]